jgi:hypothetical protein
MLQLAQRFGLDLADAFARHRELLADFFQRVVGVHADADAEAHAQHALLVRRERGQHWYRGRPSEARSIGSFPPVKPREKSIYNFWLYI